MVQQKSGAENLCKRKINLYALLGAIVMTEAIEFEDWLERQDLPLEDTLTKEKYIEKVKTQVRWSEKSIPIFERVYERRYEVLEPSGIRPVERTYTVAGEKFKETRYAITGEPGLWGRYKAYEFAQQRMGEAGEPEKQQIATANIEAMNRAPETKRKFWRA
jgi:hypothetical protein